VRLVRLLRSWWLDVAALLAVLVVFVIPFAFIVLTASKTLPESSRLEFTLPTTWQLLPNLGEVLNARNGLMFTAMRNSILLTVVSVTFIVILSAMVGYVLQRRQDRLAGFVTVLMLAGLVVPPAIVPTIYVLQSIGLFKTLAGMVLVEVAILMPFSVLVFRAFVSAIPRELDEAALMDGANPLTLFLKVILPLLRPAMITVIVVASVGIYNDFTGPLYFLPGSDNATVQATLFQFASQWSTQWNLLFADVLFITIPPLIMFIFFQRQLVAGMTAGAVKG
jgi:raffinose/stachyose/melibiose transport system permease protein